MPILDLKDKGRYASFTRRSLLLSGGMGAIFAVLTGRLYQLQIVEGDQFKAAAENNRVNERLIAPLRGRILDRFANELANNRRNYRVLLVPEQATEGVNATLDMIGRVIEISDYQRQRILRDIAQNKKFVPVTVVENLSWDEFARINLHLPYLPGMQPDVGETRAYPYGDQFVHVLGYVAAVSPEDKKDDNDPLLDLPGFRIGKRGIEKTFDRQVRGKAGVSRVEVNAYGRVIRELSHDPGTPGDDVYLTIDRDLQQVVNQRLAGQSGACCVMDVQNGDVLALASTPGFDPNLFNIGITNTQWQGLVNDEYKPLLNKAIGGVYPPGSTFKPGMALAAVDNGLENFEVDCTGSMTLGDHVFHCWSWKKGGHGRVGLERGIQVSCDIFFYQVAMKLGIDKIAEMANRLGYGQVTGIELPGELAGIIPTPEWKLKKFGVPWQLGETLNTGIGQGYVLVSPLQLCTAAARIASGKAVLPRIAHTVGARLQPRPAIAPLGFSEEALTHVRAGMNAAVNVPGGTAYAMRITEPGFEMAGKTGTAQVRRITQADRASGRTGNAGLPWNLREHALFISFAPVSAPRYACSVIVEHGAAALEPQAGVARDILLYAQQRGTLNLQTDYPVQAASLLRTSQ